MKLILSRKNEFLAEHTVRKEFRWLLAKCKYLSDIHQHKNNKTNEPHKFDFKSLQRLEVILKRWSYLVTQNKINKQKKKWWKCTTLVVIEVVLVQYNLVDNQY